MVMERELMALILGGSLKLLKLYICVYFLAAVSSGISQKLRN
jgi:hypothetical protein